MITLPTIPTWVKVMVETHHVQRDRNRLDGDTAIKTINNEAHAATLAAEMTVISCDSINTVENEAYASRLAMVNKKIQDKILRLFLSWRAAFWNLKLRWLTSRVSC